LFVMDRPLFELAALMFRIDLFAFGGGFASVPLMFHEIVEVRGWLEPQKFLDGIALGQVTPGPIVISATFVGYLFYGPVGGLIATLGIFLPSFLILVSVTPYFDRLRRLAYFNRAIRGIQNSFVGLLLIVTIRFALNIPWDLARALLAAAALIAAAFLGVPKAIVLYTRQRQGIRPSYEASYAVAGPLFLVAATAWMAISEARGLYFISGFVTPTWVEIAGPLIYVPALLMNLGVLVLNVISLTRRRKGLD